MVAAASRAEANRRDTGSRPTRPTLPCGPRRPPAAPAPRPARSPAPSGVRTGPPAYTRWPMKRPYRVVVAKPGLDGHDRGAKVDRPGPARRRVRGDLHRAAPDPRAGGPGGAPGGRRRRRAVAAVRGAPHARAPRVVDGPARPGSRRRPRDRGRDHPRGDIPTLKEMGVAEVFTPGASLPTIVQSAGRGARPTRGGGRRRLTAWARQTGAPDRAAQTHPAAADDGLRPRADETGSAGRRPARATARGQRGGSLRVPGQAVLRPLRHPHVARRRGRHRRRGRGPGRRGRLPGGGEGPGEGGRAGQGRRHQAGRRRRRGAPPRVGHLGPRHPAATSCTGCGSSTRRTSSGSTTPASPSTGRPSCTCAWCRRKGGVDIEEVAATDPDAIARLHVDPVDGLVARRRRRARGGGRARRRGPRAGGRGPGDAVPLLRRGRLRPGRDQPADPHHRRPGPRARRQGDPGRQRRLPPPRVGGVRRHRGARRARAAGQGAGPQLHRPVGIGGHHRQRRGPGHEHARRGEPGGGIGRQLPRHRRRRQRRRHGRRARGHQHRRGGAGRSS